MNADILRAALSGLEDGKKTALATVTHVSGSAPGVVGAMMAVFDDGTQVGTVGGGKVEYIVLERIKEAFLTGQGFDYDYDLGKDGDIGMVCGGQMKGFVNIMLPNRRLIIFGAGHISQQITVLAASLPFDIIVVDERAELKDLFAPAVSYLNCSPKEALNRLQIDRDTFVVLVNRSHTLDNEALRLVIDKPVAYIGMMGSRTKIADTRASLASEGVPTDLIERVYMPIGLDICGGTPVQIAFSIVSEIIAATNGKTGGHRSRLQMPVNRINA